MKKVILFIFFIILHFIIKAQTYAIINDKDGFVNVRKDRSIKSPIIDKIYANSVFFYDEEDKSEWVGVFNYKANSGTGYIHKSKILPLSKLKSIKKIKLYKDSCITYNDSISIVIKSSLFNSKRHTLSYEKMGSGKDMFKVLAKIDDKHIWGTDGDLPKECISYIRVIKNKKNILIPKNAFDDLYQPALETLKVYFAEHDTVYIEMDNSDGAGYYSVIWIIKNNQYLTRYIDNSNA